MSMETTKVQLEKLLTDSDNKVIALLGRWGTGKTHMWGELCKATQDDLVSKSLSVTSLHVLTWGVLQMDGSHNEITNPVSA